MHYLHGKNISLYRNVSSLFDQALSRDSSLQFRLFSTLMKNSSINKKNKKNERMTCSEATTLDGRWELPIQIHHPTSSLASNSPIILICGWAGVGSVDWGAIPKILAAKTNRNVLTYDARGLGNATLLSPLDSGLESLSLEIMASDTLDIIDSYYNAYLGTSAKDNIGCKREFCVGGASMGGMVAQVLAHSLHGSQHTGMRLNAAWTTRKQIYSISSLGLISSAPVRKYNNTGSYPMIDCSIPHNHFLASFDGFHRNEDQITCTKRFFEALGDAFLSRPGRTKMRDKLISSFLSTRAGFKNGMSLEWIFAQRNVLMQESHGLWYPNLDHIPAVVNFDDEPLHLSALNIPSIILHGKDDRVIPVHHAKKLHHVMNSTQNFSPIRTKTLRVNSELALIEDCDHLCWITNGHDLTNALGKFWSR